MNDKKGEKNVEEEQRTNRAVTFKSTLLLMSRRKQDQVLLSLIFTAAVLCVEQHDPNAPCVLIEHKLDKVFLRACVSSPRTQRNAEDKTSAARRIEERRCPPFEIVKHFCGCVVDKEENAILIMKVKIRKQMQTKKRNEKREKREKERTRNSYENRKIELNSNKFELK